MTRTRSRPRVLVWDWDNRDYCPTCRTTPRGGWGTGAGTCACCRTPRGAPNPPQNATCRDRHADPV